MNSSITRLTIIFGTGFYLWILAGILESSDACGSLNQLVNAYEAYKALKRVQDQGFSNVELDGFEICGLDFSTHKKQAVFDADPIMSETTISATDCSKLCLAHRFKGIIIQLQMENYTIDNGAGITIPDITEDQCLDFCRHQEKLSTIKIMHCHGATYNKPRGVCYLFDDNSQLLAPNGDVIPHTPIYNDEYVYYDKICLLDDAGALCSGTLDTFPQKVLIGFNQQVDSVTSFEQCAESCIFYNSQVAGSCQSAMYYPEEAKSNCLLNFGDHVSEPIFFLDQSTDRIVQYFSLRSCSAFVIDDTNDVNDSDGSR